MHVTCGERALSTTRPPTLLGQLRQLSFFRLDEGYAIVFAKEFEEGVFVLAVQVRVGFRLGLVEVVTERAVQKEFHGGRVPE